MGEEVEPVHEEGERTSGHDPLVVLTGHGEEVPVCRVADLGPPDLATVDALARLQLAARRRGWSVGLRGVDDAVGDLCGLLDLVGLAGLLDDVPVLDDPGRDPGLEP